MRSSPVASFFPAFRFRIYGLLLTGCYATAGCSPSEPVGETPGFAPDAPRKNTPASADSQGRKANGSDRQKPLAFSDVTADSGIDAVYSADHAWTILETVGGGVALCDFDRDGFLDVLFPQGGHIDRQTAQVSGLPLRVFRNQGGLHFSEVQHDLTGGRNLNYSHGCITPDMNNDGFPDVVVTCYGTDLVLINNGDGTLAEIARLRPQDSSQRWSTGAAALDVDTDGDLDLYVARYLDWNIRDEHCTNPVQPVRDVCPPSKYPAAPDTLYSNDKLIFSEIRPLDDAREAGRALGVIAVDADANGFTDLYVANDAGENHLLKSHAKSEFEESALWFGVSGNEFGASEGSMGVDAGDVNGDGICDLWVTNFEYEDNSLYLGHPDSLFEHATIAMNLSGPAKSYVGFGTSLADFDGDGWLDIVVVNGHVYYEGSAAGYRQPALAYRNQAGRRFEPWPVTSAWFQQKHAARGLAVGDLDNTGSPDMVIVRQNTAVTVLKNELSVDSIALRLTGTVSNRDAVGAVVTVSTGNRAMRRWITSGAGYLSQTDSRILLPASSADQDSQIHVQWPGGHSETFTGFDVELSSGKTLTLVEGSGGL